MIIDMDGTNERFLSQIIIKFSAKKRLCLEFLYLNLIKIGENVISTTL